jgi:hypothetical protein
MRIRSRWVAASAVTLATVVVGCLGVRSELTRAQATVNGHVVRGASNSNASGRPEPCPEPPLGFVL